MGGYKFSAHCTNISAHKIYFRASLFICGEYFLDWTAIAGLLLRWREIDRVSISDPIRIPMKPDQCGGRKENETIGRKQRIDWVIGGL